MLDVVVMAHPKRDAAATQLADTLRCNIVWDTRDDEWHTGSTAWQIVGDQARDWAAVIQDDAQPVPNFRYHAANALLQAPRTAISFYVGTGRPRAQRVNYAVSQARQQQASWLECDSLLWGVAIALPVEHVPGLLEWAQTSTLPYDQRISAYFRRIRRQPVRHTWPSLVDHADGEPLVNHARRPQVERRAHQLGPWQSGGPVVRI